MQTEVPAEMKYVLDRGGFEYGRAIGNVSFMLSQHLDDTDDSFLDTALFVHIQERAEEAAMQNSLIGENVASVLTENRARKFRFIDDNYMLEYREVL